jgi:hypothetical protein
MVEQMFHIMGGKILSFPFGCCCHNRSIFQVDICAAFKTSALVGRIRKGEKRSASRVKEGSATGAFFVRFHFVSSKTRSLMESVTLPCKPFRISRRAGPVGENAAAYRTLLSRNILLWGFGDTIGFLQEICSDVAS